MADKPPDPLTAMLTAGLMGGGRSEEHIEYNPRTQVWVQMLQAMALFLALAFVLGGFWLAGRVITWMVGELALTETLILALGLGVVGMGVRYAVRKLADATAWSSRLGLLLSELFLSAAVTVLLLNLVGQLYRAWTWQQGLSLFLAIGGWVSGSLLLWRLGNELYNPEYPRPPIVDLLRDYLLQGTGETKIVLKPYPVYLRSNGGDAPIVSSAGPVEGLNEEDEGATIAVDSLFEDLVWFVETAIQIGGFQRDPSQTKEGMVRAPRRLAPSGKRLTRPYYGELLDEAARWGIVETGGGGASGAWKMEPDAVMVLLREVERRTTAATGEKARQAGNQAGRQAARD